jgi:hypothetical protein
MDSYNQQYGQQQIPSPTESAVITKTLKTVLLIFVIVTWLLALPLKAYNGGEIDIEGYLCLLFGWASIIANGFGFFAWLANLPFFIAFFMFAFSRKKPAAKAAFILSSIAFVLSLNALFVSELPTASHRSSDHVSVSFGAFIWIFSMAVLTLVTFLNMKFFREEIKKKPQPPINYHNYYQQPFPPPQSYFPGQNHPEEPTRKGMGDNF